MCVDGQVDGASKEALARELPGARVLRREMQRPAALSSLAKRPSLSSSPALWTELCGVGAGAPNPLSQGSLTQWPRCCPGRLHGWGEKDPSFLLHAVHVSCLPAMSVEQLLSQFLVRPRF